MIVRWEDKEPRMDPSVRMAESAAAVGDVTAEAGVSLWYGAVVRGDVSPIRIGRDTNIQDNAEAYCRHSKTSPCLYRH